MVMSVVTNVASLTAHRYLTRTSDSTTRSLERLSSGYRINRAADDAAGLAISEGLRSQIGGMTQAVRNTQDGISVAQTADGALDQTTSLLHRMRDLAVQAANSGVLDDAARRGVQREVVQLKAEVDRIADTTTFNGTRLLDGTYRGTFQVGANTGDTLTLAIGRVGTGMDVVGLQLSEVDVTDEANLANTVVPAVSDEEGVPAAGRMTIAGDFTAGATYAALRGTISYQGRSFDLGSVDYSTAVTTQDHLDALNVAARSALGTTGYPYGATPTALVFNGEVPPANSTAADAAAMTPRYTGMTGASGAIAVIDRAISRVSGTRADIGAFQNRLEHTLHRLDVGITNTGASESRIRDTDMAAEMTVFSSNQVLTQAGTAMLAQANQVSQSILKLLG
jgi:flagellin-like hook-associated protein FlgL